MGSEQREKTGLTIGALAREAGVNVETVRYYQRRGLIEEPAKPYSGFRHYPLATVDRLRFIKRAQSLGFSLAEIADLLALGQGHCVDVCQRAEAKRERIQQQIDDLRRLQATLDRLIASCHEERASGCCPMV
ncbi:MAG: MerR family transcriptional regulator [Thiotrichales bacterium]